MKLSRRTILVAALCVIALTYLRTNKVLSAPPTQPTARQQPAWTLSQADKRKLLEAAAKIRTGDTYDKVVAGFGKPTVELDLIAKGSTVSHGRSLRYQAAIWEANLVNEFHDEWVYVILDTSGKVTEVAIRLSVSE